MTLDIDDVNKALTQIHEELDQKCNLEQVFSCNVSLMPQWTIKLLLMRPYAQRTALQDGFGNQAK